MINNTAKVIIAIVLAVFLVVVVTAYNNINFLIINSKAEVIETVKKILTTGDWQMGDAVLNFSDTEFTAVKSSSIDGEDEKLTYTYELADAVVESGVYKVSWIATDSGGNCSDVTDIQIVVGGKKDNKYYLYSSSLPFTKVYAKTFDIVYTRHGF